MNMKEENAILKVNEYTVLDIAVSSDEGDKINQRILCYWNVTRK